MGTSADGDEHALHRNTPVTPLQLRPPRQQRPLKTIYL